MLHYQKKSLEKYGKKCSNYFRQNNFGLLENLM